MKLIQTALIAAVLAIGAVGAQADTLVDRGLPSDNINNSAGANRSNVSWAFTQYTPSDYYMVGDTFTNTSSTAWNITTLRLWTVGSTDTATLWGAGANGTLGVISNATYADGITSYQGQTGALSDIHQVDFSVNIILAAGETYSFFLDGSGNGRSDIFIPFVHASNAALGGVAADSADNQMLWAESNGSSIVDSGTWDSGAPGWGWDKSSDVNVQAFGNEVPEPGSIALVGVALLGAAVARRRKA